MCGPANTGALTIGFWQNKNGQGIISGGAGGEPECCTSGTWLRRVRPVPGRVAVPPPRRCATVATYVSSVIGAATCGGTTCNAMLKAQMLATALDVYFSDPALGGDKIGARGPIGSARASI